MVVAHGCAGDNPMSKQKLVEQDIARSQARLASLFGNELTRCAVCGELIFANETLPCRGVENCAARMGEIIR
jgi:hypothetical protein